MRVRVDVAASLLTLVQVAGSAVTAVAYAARIADRILQTLKNGAAK